MAKLNEQNYKNSVSCGQWLPLLGILALYYTSFLSFYVNGIELKFIFISQTCDLRENCEEFMQQPLPQKKKQ